MKKSDTDDLLSANGYTEGKIKITDRDEIRCSCQTCLESPSTLKLPKPLNLP